MVHVGIICTMVIFYSGVGTLLTLPNTAHATGGSGSIKTTNASCETNINHYNVGDDVWIMGDNFDTEEYAWNIKGLPGGASSDPNTEVASGDFEVTEDSFCFNAYTVLDGDDGEYKATFGNKHDNYHVDGEGDTEEEEENNEEDTDCTPVTTVIVSDETNTVTGGGDAVATFVHANWASIADATWIWSSALVNPDNMGADETVEFNKSFSIDGTITNATLELASDNGYDFAINGDSVASNAGEHNYESVTGPLDVTSTINEGSNDIVASVTNMANGNTNPEENPAGLLYKLTIDHLVCENPPVEEATVTATKIVCDSETDLPNWGAGGPEITGTTASDFLETHPNCHSEPWDFAWSLDGVGNPGDGTTGTGGAGWNGFSDSTPTSIPAGQRIWFREQPSDDYIPFTGQNTTESVSAEIYCSTDVLNYDNWEFIDTVADTAYSCVGFNVPKIPACDPEEELIQNGDFETPVLPNATWDIIPDTNPLLKWLVAWTSPQTGGRLGLEIQNHVAGDPAQGEQHAELDGDHPVTMWQEVPTVIGQSYVLNFKYSARPGRTTTDNTIDVKIDGAVVGATLANDGTALSNTLWDAETRTFTATGTSTKIEFTDTGTDTSFGGYLDDVSLRCGTVEDDASHITVTKIVSGSDTPPSAFTLFVDETVVTSGIPTEFEPNTYTVYEAGMENFTPSFSGACVADEGNTARINAIADWMDKKIALQAAIDADPESPSNPTREALIVDINEKITALQSALTATVELGIDEDVQCTITNTYEAPPVDMCPNIDELQTEVPEGYSLDDGQCIEDVVPPTDVCPNILEVQTEVPQGYSLIDGQCIENVTPPTNGGGGGGGSRHSSSGSSSDGRVLGATASCGIYLEKFMAYRRQNDSAQVIKLQQFLNNYMHLNLATDGIFGRGTESAVRAFQTSRLGTVLTPWGRNLPTGLVYLTTITDINNIMCPTLNIPIPSNLIPFSQHPLAPRAI